MDLSEESSPLVPSSDSSDSERATKTTASRYVPLEIIAVLHFASLMALVPITQFYVIDQISEKYGVRNATNDDNNYCVKDTSNNSKTMDLIQSESANILMYLTFFSTFLAVIPILVMGALADRFGRKLPLIISISGILLKEIVMIVTVYLRLPLWVLAIGEFFQGITGHFGGFLAAIMGMIADITISGRSRAIRITILEAVLAVTLALSSLGIGFWIKDGNYRHPMIFCIVCTVVAILFAICIMPETSHLHKQNDRSFKEVCGACLRLYKNSTGNRKKKLVLGQIIFSIYVAAVVGRTNVQTLFLLHEPLCWTELHVQIFNCVQILINWGSIVIAVRILHTIFHDYSIVVIGIVSATAAAITLAFAKKDWIVYIHVPIGILAYSISPVMRSLLSRLVSAQEQGSLFASIGSLELLFTSIAQLVYGYIYQVSVSFLPGLVFMIITGFLFVALCLSLVLYNWMREPTPVEETTIKIS